MAKTSYREFLLNLHREKVEAEKQKESERKARSDAAKAAGIIPSGLSVFSGETPVTVNDSAVFEYVTGSPEDAHMAAKQIVNQDGSAMVKRYETTICPDTGIELLVTKKRAMFGMSVPVVASVYTDEKGIILPWTEVRARLSVEQDSSVDSEEHFHGDDYSGELTHVGTWVSHPDKERVVQAPTDESVGSRLRADGCKAFAHLMSKSSGKPVDREKLMVAESWAAMAKIAEKKTAEEKLLATRPEAPEAEIQLPQGPGFEVPESPTKGMTLLQRLKAEARAAKKKAVNPYLAAIKEHEAEISALNAHLRPIVEQIKELRANKVGLVQKNETIFFKEDLLRDLNERAWNLRSDILYVREQIKALKNGQEVIIS